MRADKVCHFLVKGLRGMMEALLQAQGGRKLRTAGPKLIFSSLSKMFESMLTLLESPKSRGKSLSNRLFTADGQQKMHAVCHVIDAKARQRCHVLLRPSLYDQPAARDACGRFRLTGCRRGGRKRLKKLSSVCGEPCGLLGITQAGKVRACLPRTASRICGRLRAFVVRLYQKRTCHLRKGLFAAFPPAAPAGLAARCRQAQLAGFPGRLCRLQRLLKLWPARFVKVTFSRQRTLPEELRLAPGDGQQGLPVRSLPLCVSPFASSHTACQRAAIASKKDESPSPVSCSSAERPARITASAAKAR